MVFNSLTRWKVEKTPAMLPKSWKKPFNIGIVIPAKITFCNECSKKIIVIGVKIKVTKVKEMKLLCIY